MSEAIRTRDHETMRQWAQKRGGHPARVRGSGKGGILRIDFGEPEPALEKIDWEQFFADFDRNRLDFLYQDRTADGSISRFNIFVEQE